MGIGRPPSAAAGALRSVGLAAGARGNPAVRTAGNGKNHAGQGHRQGSAGYVFGRQAIQDHEQVVRRIQQAHRRHLQPGPEALAVDHLHRRARHVSEPARRRGEQRGKRHQGRIPDALGRDHHVRKQQQRRPGGPGDGPGGDQPAEPRRQRDLAPAPPAVQDRSPRRHGSPPDTDHHARQERSSPRRLRQAVSASAGQADGGIFRERPQGALKLRCSPGGPGDNAREIQTGRLRQEEKSEDQQEEK
mmetsp:Transcript_7521/g.18501  ORF Transcript_7521/g.18501 Transcript_7521/m.18501 type:complete len:246 (+) Transcript_7521:513-1250(+)